MMMMMMMMKIFTYDNESYELLKCWVRHNCQLDIHVTLAICRCCMNSMSHITVVS